MSPLPERKRRPVGGGVDPRLGGNWTSPSYLETPFPASRREGDA